MTRKQQDILGALVAKGGRTARAITDELEAPEHRARRWDYQEVYGCLRRMMRTHAWVDYADVDGRGQHLWYATDLGIGEYRKARGD